MRIGKVLRSLVLGGLLIISGCSQADSDGYTAGDLRAIDHVDGRAINGFSVNGYHVSGLGGGACCVMLPNKWYPGMQAKIEWETDPKTAPPFPGYQDWDKYQVWEKQVKSSFQQHSTIVDIPAYGKERCGMTVHFLTCNRVKVTTVCEGYDTPNYPIKEPLHMKEPASCPK
ncbi:DUF3304 domain-containing protein [Ewingella americana]